MTDHHSPATRRRARGRLLAPRVAGAGRRAGSRNPGKL